MKEMTGAEFIGLASTLLHLGTEVVKLAGSAGRNKEKCKLLAEHVQMIMCLVRELKKCMPSTQWMKELLQNLDNALREGEELVRSCQKKRTWSHVFRTQKKNKKLDALGQRISKILETFHVGNAILIYSINNGRFFENVLQKLLQDGACERLPPNVKEELKSSIMKLPNQDNMSSDARALLEWIKKDITYSRRVVATRGSSRAQRGEESSTRDDLTVGIVELTKRIMKDAPMHKGGDIQRLAHLVEKVGNIIQQPEISEPLLLDPMTRTRLVELKEELDRIADNFVWYNGAKKHNKIKSVMLCGPDNSFTDEVLKDIYKIEYYIALLHVIALHQLNYMR